MARLCPPRKYERALELFEDDPEEGLAELERLAEKYTKDPDVRHALGATYLDLDRPFDALEHLEWAEKKQPTHHVRRALVDAYLRLEMIAHAGRVARRDPGLELDVTEEQPADGTDENALSMKDQLAFERARTAILHGEARGIHDMRRLSDRHPDYAPARNVLATGHFIQGDLEGYRNAAREALRLAPQDVHALLNAVRLAVLEEGVEGARAYRKRVIDALDATTGTGAVNPLTVAKALALMDDAPAVDRALRAWDDSEEDAFVSDADYATLDQLDSYLQEHEKDPRAPLVRLHDVFFSFVHSWLETGTGDGFEGLARKLADVPGLVSLMPRTLGYEAPMMAVAFAHALLSDATPPAPDGRTWPEVLREVVERGPGEPETRMRILTVLGEHGLLDDDQTVTFDGAEGGLRFHQLELNHGTVPSGLPAADDARYLKAMEALTAGDAARSGEELARLHERHPSSVAVHFNLALAERLTGGEAAERSQERIERIVREHPDYLFARAQLATDAIEAGDLERAEELLVLPTGAKQFHVLAYATFLVAQGFLALAKGEFEDVEQTLDSIAELMGEDAGPYRMLEAAIDAHDLRSKIQQMMVEDDEELLEGLDDERIEATAEALADDFEEQEPPSREDLTGLAQVRDTWQVAHGPLTFIGAEDEPVQLAYGGVVVQEDGLLRHVTMNNAPFDGRALYALVASACATPASPVPACRPMKVLVPDATQAISLSLKLSGTPIAVQVGDVSTAQDVLALMAADIHPDAPPTFLSDHDDDEIDAFLEAAQRYFDAEPWDVFEGDTFLAFHLHGGPWRYASVMGQLGEEFGLSLVESWAGAQALLDQDAPMIPGAENGGSSSETTLAAVGPIESISLAPLSYLAPADAAHYVERDVEPYFYDEYPVVFRFTDEGQVRPRLELSAYTALLESIACRARRARTRVRAFRDEVETSAGGISLRFPATGDEDG